MINQFFRLFLLLFLFGTTVCYAANGDHDKKLTGKLSYDKKEGKPKIFVEGIRLDMDFMRRNMRFVDFVNDPAVSDIHIIINNRISGSGGQVYSLMFNNNTFEGIADYTLTCTTAASDTYEEQRKKITDALTMGLMPFVNQTEASEQITVRYRGNEEVQNIQVNDPWRNWTFRGGFNGNLYLEESRKNYNYSYNLRADRVTEEWKIRNMGSTSIRTREYMNEGEKYRSENSTNSVTSSVVKSLSPRWSAGAFGSYYNSNYRNTVYSVSIKPALEYNIFPWDVSDRKVFTIAYYIGPEWKKYYEETIYDKLKESTWEQTLRLDLQLIKTWGEIEAGLDATNLMHDWSKNRITFDTDLSVRIIRGLSVNFGFRIENIHDQIYLAKGDVSLEDVLLNKVQLPSTFEIGADFGVRVQFGSIYNNIVNNRL
ncbi:hypothetical protein N9164_03860 [Draconibacterium sp.]|nr:hypothetical protein [Draconibacterium sp.]